MVEAVANSLKAMGNALKSVGLKEPWKMTGSWSVPDYLHFLPTGLEYRKFSPGSQPVKAIIPHDVPRQVYDIKYFVRDYRRSSKYSARTVDNKAFDFEKLYTAAPLKPEQVKNVARPEMMPTRGT